MPSRSGAGGEEDITRWLITITATTSEMTNMTPHTPMMMIVIRLYLRLSTRFHETAEPNGKVKL